MGPLRKLKLKSRWVRVRLANVVRTSPLSLLCANESVSRTDGEEASSEKTRERSRELGVVGGVLVYALSVSIIRGSFGSSQLLRRDMLLMLKSWSDLAP
jgi:hypothetical protein